MRALRNSINQNRPKHEKKKKMKKMPHCIRLQKEEIDKITVPGVLVEYPDGPEKTDSLCVILSVKSGFWKNGTFKFSIDVPQTYPMDPPKVTCIKTPIYHPNIDICGNVCLNILRVGWNPTSTIENIIYGLILLFESPNFTDPLPSHIFPEGYEPHELWKQDRNKFEIVVRKTITGGVISELGNMDFPR